VALGGRDLVQEAPSSPRPHVSGRREVQNRLCPGDRAHGRVGGEQLGVVKRPCGEPLGPVESHERHRQGRERAEEGEVVGGARAPRARRCELRAGEQRACPADDVRVVLERRLARQQRDARAAAVGRGDAVGDLLDECPQRESIVLAVGPQRGARAPRT
jgi:hypothetical protein